LAGWGRIARVGALAACSLVLAQCSASHFGKSGYSQKVIADGEPIPKGGGSYRVGQPYSINGHTYYPSENPSYRNEGIASWYGPDFHGRLTANGEIYDMNAISAAHTTMPLPSYARVTNLQNGKSIIVRVNDRGPYARGRVIDVSIGTAKALGFYGSGIAPVRVEYVGRAPLEGSDDTMLLATLRDGNPAPAPSRTMLASAQPVAGPAGVRTRERDMETPDLAARAQARSVVRLPDPARPEMRGADHRLAQARPSPASAGQSADPIGGLIRSDPSLGLMSGRGLY
jgi:rare lipoprotein A